MHPSPADPPLSPPAPYGAASACTEHEPDSDRAHRPHSQPRSLDAAGRKRRSRGEHFGRDRAEGGKAAPTVAEGGRHWGTERAGAGLGRAATSRRGKTVGAQRGPTPPNLPGVRPGRAGARPARSRIPISPTPSPPPRRIPPPSPPYPLGPTPPTTRLKCSRSWTSSMNCSTPSNASKPPILPRL